MVGAVGSLTPMLATGLPRDGHLHQARGLPHPFHRDASMEADLEFTVWANARIGPRLSPA
eukprot:7840810-Karenia_brevis.AAC.1